MRINEITLAGISKSPSFFFYIFKFQFHFLILKKDDVFKEKQLLRIKIIVSCNSYFPKRRNK